MSRYDDWLTNDHAGDHDGECGAYSPEGTFQCNLVCDHVTQHSHTTENGLLIQWQRRHDDFDEDGMPTVRTP